MIEMESSLVYERVLMWQRVEKSAGIFNSASLTDSGRK